MDSKIYVYMSMLLDVKILILTILYYRFVYVYLSNVSIASWLDHLNNN